MNKQPIRLRDEFITHEMDISWDTVWEFWRKNEEHLPHWIEYWQAKGFENWSAWRSEKVQNLRLKTLDWKYHHVELPFISVPRFRGGPFKSWAERFYKDRTFPTFAELAEDPDGIVAHPGIIGILMNFPVQTVMSGLVLDGEIYVVEGMHRSSAIALTTRDSIMEKGDTNLRTDVWLCLAQWPPERGPLPLI